MLGSDCGYHVRIESSGNLGDKANSAMLIGYCTDKGAYKFLDVSNNIVIASRDFHFDENCVKQNCNAVHEIEKSIISNVDEPENIYHSSESAVNLSKQCPGEARVQIKVNNCKPAIQ